MTPDQKTEAAVQIAAGIKANPEMVFTDPHQVARMAVRQAEAIDAELEKSESLLQNARLALHRGGWEGEVLSGMRFAEKGHRFIPRCNGNKASCRQIGNVSRDTLAQHGAARLWCLRI